MAGVEFHIDIALSSLKHSGITVLVVEGSNQGQKEGGGWMRRMGGDVAIACGLVAELLVLDVSCNIH